jgi:hypothetical protein
MRWLFQGMLCHLQPHAPSPRALGHRDDGARAWQLGGDTRCQRQQQRHKGACVRHVICALCGRVWQA